MAILNRQREMEYTKKLKENELVVYTATPEQIEKLMGGKDMGRLKGSKNKVKTLEMATADKPIGNATKKSEKTQAKVDIIMEEAEANKAIKIIGSNIESEKLTDDVIKANPAILAKYEQDKLKEIVQTVSPRLPIVEQEVAPKDEEIKADFRGKLKSRIRKAALEVCLEEIACFVTDLNDENMHEKLKEIRDTANAALDEFLAHRI